MLHGEQTLGARVEATALMQVGADKGCSGSEGRWQG